MKREEEPHPVTLVVTSRFLVDFYMYIVPKILRYIYMSCMHNKLKVRENQLDLHVVYAFTVQYRCSE